MNWITPVNVTPSSSGWQDVDASSYIPSGATGVIVHIVSGTLGSNIGLRKNGSTDNRTEAIDAEQHMWAMVGVDTNRIFEAYRPSVAPSTYYLVGYTTTDASFFTNAVSKSISTSGSWVDVDISGDTGGDTAIGAVIEFSTSLYEGNVRKNGSTDNRYNSTIKADHTWAIIGVDANEIFEVIVESTTTIYIVGYIKSGATFNTNATDISLTTTGTWTDLSALPSGAIGGFIEVYVTGSGTGDDYGLRKNGSSEDIKSNNYKNRSWGIVECDSSRIIEGYIYQTSTDFYLVGYAVSGASYSQTLSENLLVADAVSKSVSKDILNTILVGDTIQKLTGKIANEAILIIDTIFNVPQKMLSETVSIIDSVLCQITAKLFSETTTITDSVAKLASKTLSSVIVVGDEIFKTVLLTKNETLVIVDSIQVIFGKMLAETITIIDSIIKQTQKTLNETIIAGDTMTKNLTRSFIEAITIIDEKILKLVRVLNEAIIVEDVFLKTANKVFTEGVAITDVVLKLLWRQFSETLTIVDNVVVGVVGKTLYETISVVDAISRFLEKTFVESLAIVDYFKMVQSMTIDEIISVVDAVETLSGKTILLVETISIKDLTIRYILKLTKPLLTAWTKTNKPTSEWKKTSKS